MRRLFIALDERDCRRMAPCPRATSPSSSSASTRKFGSSDEPSLYEGCLSFPGRNAAISRPKRVKVRAFDRHGNPFELEAEDMLARCVCHETNHLDGVTILDLADHFYEDEEEFDEDGEE